MLLSTEEFLSIKDEMVRDVLVRLRTLAKSEAELLFREYKNYPGALPHFSERISNAINVATDVMTDRMSTVSPGDPLWDELLPLVRENLPAKLAEVAWPRVLEGRFPTQYTRNAIASCLANKLVYAEGIHLVESQPTDRLADRMITYYREDRKIAALVAELESQGLASLPKEKVDAVKHLLRRGGTRTAMAVF
jgi:glutamate dehydrogenase